MFRLWRVPFLASPRKGTKRRRPRRSRSHFVRLPCDARRNGPPRNSLTQLWLRSLRHPRRTAPVPPALLGGPNGASPQAPGGVPFFLVDPSTNVWTHELFGVPVGPAEKHRALRGSRRALSEHPQSPDCGCELRSRLRVRASQGSRVATGTVGACFLWVLSLHEQRRYLADRRNLAVQQT